MRIGALVLGILGGVFGIISAIAALFIGGMGGAFEAEGAGTVTNLGWSALIFCFVGLLGGGLVLAKPKLGSGLLLVAAIGITISISLFAVVAAPLLLLAAILGFFGRNKRDEKITVQTAEGSGASDANNSRVR